MSIKGWDPATVNIKVSKEITDAVSEDLKIAPERVFIEMTHENPDFFGWKGTTLTEALKWFYTSF